MAVVSSAQAPEIPSDGTEHPGRALHERLHHHGRLLALVLPEQEHHLPGSPASAMNVSSSGRYSAWKCRCRPPTPCRSCRRGKRRAGDEARPPVVPALAPILEGHLRAISTAVAPLSESTRLSPSGAISTSRRASSMAGGWERPSIVEMRTRPSCSRRPRRFAGAHAVNVAPERRDAVDVAAALRVDQARPLGPLHDQRILGAPAALLGERMPEVSAIRRGQIHTVDAS